MFDFYLKKVLKYHAQLLPCNVLHVKVIDLDRTYEKSFLSMLYVNIFTHKRNTSLVLLILKC